MSQLAQILKDSNYKLTQFKVEHIDALETQVIEKENKGKVSYKTTCLIRDKEINLTSEEVIRQLYLIILTEDYQYPKNRIQVEYSVSFGTEKKRADIAIMDKDRPDVPYIIIELKKPKLKEGKEQLKSYCNATGAPMGVWTNGNQISYYHRKDPNYFEDIPHIPRAIEKLSDVLTERWTIADLIKKDKLLRERKSLKDLILEMEDEVLANAGVDVFEELFKLIFTKLYDEMEGGRNSKRHLEFRNYGDTEFELRAKIQDLFKKACHKWEGVFSDNSKIELTPSHLSICVASLQDVKLFNSNLDVIDEAFEYLINKTSKGEKGQYFTPRYVIDMCVKMLNPQEDEMMIDTAAGSCGFPVHTIFHVWKQILADENIPQSHLFTSEKKPARCEDYVCEKVFAIDFDEKAVRVGRTLNLIAGDGQTNVLHLNTLDYDRWHERVENDEGWRDTYGEGWKRLKRLRKDKDNQQFEFDILMANPPFAGDIKETRMLAKYELGKKPDGKRQSAVGRDILFIERNLDFLKPGGRMAVVLPQGRFNNSSDKVIREFIADRCRILAVVGLHGNVFKPHTGTKTSVLLVQKWTNEHGICPKREDYPVFFATMQLPSKDNSGDKIYVKQADGESLLDEHGHLIVAQDLFNHDGLTQDGIAEAFIEFAKKENLSFFESGSFNEGKYRALLEGLEVSEIPFSTCKKIVDFRVDSETYKKEYLKTECLIRSKNFENLDELSVSVQNFGAYSLCNFIEFVDHGLPFLLAQCVRDNFIDWANVAYITQASHHLLEKSHCRKGQVLLTMAGAYLGKAAVYNKEFVCSSNQAIAKITLKTGINPYFVSTFLNSKHGQNQINRLRTVTGQPNINMSLIREILIPHISSKFQEKVEDVVRTAEKIAEESKATYTAAEDLLLESLGLKDFQPTQQNVNIKSFKDSFLSSGRLDAEYYQPKYEEIEAKIRNSNFGFCKVKDCFSQNKSTYAKDKEGFNYIEISDISVADGNVSFNFIETPDLPANAKIKLDTGDMLVSKVRPNRGAVAIINFEKEDLICSGAFTVLRQNADSPIKSETLQIFLRTKLFSDLLLKFNCGTSYPVIKDEDILNLDIPIISPETQTQIAEKIQTSFTLRQQSEKLLERAKRAVEIAIEESEGTAMDYINKQEGA